MDHRGDGRSVVIWDFDHDGWLDVTSINTNAPKIVWYHNQLGSLIQRHFLRIQLVGGNQGAKPNKKFSSRDGFGARVIVEVSGKRLVSESRGGEGFSAQNSRVLHFGLGEATSVDAINIRWPSGIEQRFESLAADQKWIAYEDPSMSPDGQALRKTPSDR